MGGRIGPYLARCRYVLRRLGGSARRRASPRRGEGTQQGYPEGRTRSRKLDVYGKLANGRPPRLMTAVTRAEDWSSDIFSVQCLFTHPYMPRGAGQAGARIRERPDLMHIWKIVLLCGCVVVAVCVVAWINSLPSWNTLIFHGSIVNAHGFGSAGYKFYPFVQIVESRGGQVILRIAEGKMFPVPQAGVEILLECSIAQGPGRQVLSTDGGTLKAWLLRQDEQYWEFDEMEPKEYWNAQEKGSIPGMFQLAGSIEILVCDNAIEFLRLDLVTVSTIPVNWGWLNHRERLTEGMIVKHGMTAYYAGEKALWERMRRRGGPKEVPAEVRGEFRLERRRGLIGT